MRVLCARACACVHVRVNVLHMYIYTYINTYVYIYTGIQCIVKGSHTILNILHCVFGACVRDVCAFSSFGICATAACVTRGACQKQVYSSTFQLTLHFTLTCVVETLAWM